MGISRSIKKFRVQVKKMSMKKKFKNQHKSTKNVIQMNKKNKKALFNSTLLINFIRRGKVN